MVPAVPPRVTVSLVTYNGMRWLPGCIASLRAQTVAEYELIVLDNASTDGTRTWLRDMADTDERMRLIESNENLGFARAHDRVISEARGDLVLLLNQDVELDQGFLWHAIGAFSSRPEVGSVQARVRRLGPNGERASMLDTTGLEVHRDRRFVSRAQGQMDGVQHSTPGPVFGVDGPVPVYRRAALQDARLPRQGGWEILDEDFYMYKEDVDLAWRLQALGWSAWYAPDAIAWHARGAGGARTSTIRDIVRTNRSLSANVRRWSWRNHRLMLLKNERVRDGMLDLPWILRRELLSLGYILVADPVVGLRAISDLIRLIPGALRKRRYLQRRLQRSRADPRTGQRPPFDIRRWIEP